jgi:hypothetical protein
MKHSGWRNALKTHLACHAYWFCTAYRREPTAFITWKPSHLTMNVT